MAEAGSHPALEISDLHVYYGESHAIQGVSMTIRGGVLAVVGRTGMGKSTLCNTIAGLKASRSGSIRIFGRETSAIDARRSRLTRSTTRWTPSERVCCDRTSSPRGRGRCSANRAARWSAR